MAALFTTLSGNIIGDNLSITNCLARDFFVSANDTFMSRLYFNDNTNSGYLLWSGGNLNLVNHTLRSSKFGAIYHASGDLHARGIDIYNATSVDSGTRASCHD